MVKKNVPLPEASHPTAIESQKWNLGEVQDKVFKTSVMNMFKNLRKDMNKCLHVDYGNTNSGMKPLKCFKT